jgi:hypothetical protein
VKCRTEDTLEPAPDDVVHTFDNLKGVIIETALSSDNHIKYGIFAVLRVRERRSTAPYFGFHLRRVDAIYRKP